MGNGVGNADALDEGVLTIYVDGSMRGNPRRGGIGIRFAWLDEDGREQVWDASVPSTENATNNQMELEAPALALDMALRGRAGVEVTQFKKILIRTDSAYVHDHLNAALYVWSKSGWKTKAGTAVLNQPDWEKLVGLLKRFWQRHHLKVTFEWKKGKIGRHAKAVDKLAKESSDSASFGRERPVAVRRKRTSASVSPDSVRIEGQLICIRILQSQYLPKLRPRSRYRYEVVDPSSPYDRQVAFAESDHALAAGHVYRVRMNTVQENPTILEVVEEIIEDLSPYADALVAPETRLSVKSVADQLERTTGKTMANDAVRRRLDRLVDEGRARRTRARTGGRAYEYELDETSE
jgi:ribonuclease HI